MTARQRHENACMQFYKNGQQKNHMREKCSRVKKEKCGEGAGSSAARAKCCEAGEQNYFFVDASAEFPPPPVNFWRLESSTVQRYLTYFESDFLYLAERECGSKREVCHSTKTDSGGAPCPSATSVPSQPQSTSDSNLRRDSAFEGQQDAHSASAPRGSSPQLRKRNILEWLAPGRVSRVCAACAHFAAMEADPCEVITNFIALNPSLEQPTSIWGGAHVMPPPSRPSGMVARSAATTGEAATGEGGVSPCEVGAISAPPSPRAPGTRGCGSGSARGSKRRALASSVPRSLSPQTTSDAAHPPLVGDSVAHEATKQQECSEETTAATAALDESVLPQVSLISSAPAPSDGL